jgi:hypothetical protein
VISPDATFSYRDGGLPRDAVCRMVVRDAAHHLADGGFATVLCNWIHDESWSNPLRAWVSDLGAMRLCLRYATLDPAVYAGNWNAEIRRWKDYYAAERITHIAVGAVILRRRNGAPNWVRPLDLSAGPSCQSSDDILRLFNASDFLDAPRGRDLFRHADVPLEGHRVDQALRLSNGAYVVGAAVFRRVPGIGLEAHVDAGALEVVLESDGRRMLTRREVLTGTAASSIAAVASAHGVEAAAPDSQGFDVGFGTLQDDAAVLFHKDNIEKLSWTLVDTFDGILKNGLGAGSGLP